MILKILNFQITKNNKKSKRFPKINKTETTPAEDKKHQNRAKKNKEKSRNPYPKQ